MMKRHILLPSFVLAVMLLPAFAQVSQVTAWNEGDPKLESSAEELERQMNQLNAVETLLDSVPDQSIPEGLANDRYSAIQRVFESEKEAKLSQVDNDLLGQPNINESLNLEALLADTRSDYRKVYEPWQTKAAIRTMVTSPDKEFLLLGGGYLFDNTIKVYRYNSITDTYDRVWDSGDEIIQSDVVSLGWGDTDNNKFPEVVAGSADGHVYVFEQTHIYDPKTNTENRFELVWKSPLHQQVWGIAVADVDKDFVTDIVVGSWDGSIHVYEYVDHSGYPFTKEHWIEYEEKYTATLPKGERITALTTADTNYNGLPEIAVGTWAGNIYLYENNGTVIWKGTQPFPLTQDDSYKLIYNNSLQFWSPITKIATGNLDNDVQNELGFLVPGQGVFTFDYDQTTQGFYFNKLIKDPPSWELGTGDHLDDESAGYPVNSYVDWMVNGSNVYAYDNSSDFREEPILEVRPAYPYNTSMAQPPNDDYSWFIALFPGSKATAVVDFGFTQEVTGDGRFADGETLRGYDLQFIMSANSTPLINQWQVQLSPDLEQWTTVETSEMTAGDCDAYCTLYIDTDPALNRKHMLSYRYVNMTLVGPGIQLVDAVKSTTLARSLKEATALTLGTVDVSYDRSIQGENEPDKIITGTSDGKLFVYEYNSTQGAVSLVWESYTEDLFNLGTNIWDIVQVQNAGTFPTWRSHTGANVTFDFSSVGTDYMSHTYAHLTAFELINPSIFNRNNDDLVITTSAGQSAILLGGSGSSVITDPFFTISNSYYGSLVGGGNYEVHHSFADTSGNGYSNIMLSGVWDPTTAADPSKDQKASASLDMWMSSFTGSGFSPFIGPLDLRSLDQTGMLTRALEKSQAQPGAVMTDLDGDGDQDIVFTNGRVYVLWNIFEGLMYRFDATYFEEINNNLKGRLYYAPQVVNFDGDDESDLVFSYSLTGDKPRYGATYWENEGNVDDPKWVEDKWLFINPEPSSNLAYNNNTNFQFVRNPEGKIINLTTFSDKLDSIVSLEADYANHDHFMLATYPLLRRVEINLRDSGTVKNFGYRVFETWNTKPELAEWSQTIQFSDIDEDGQGEIVVGDYDNNLYIFEYLTSGLNGSVNTYKRAFRSPDITQTEQLDESPYAADQLEGLTGEFNRTLWDHVQFILTGTDLDNDGKREVVAAAGLSIFIFEFTGRVDTYELMWHRDLRFSKFASLFDSSSEITALGGGLDMDYNNRGEFMVAAGPLFMIFEYSGEGKFHEQYAGIPDADGRYASVGNLAFANFSGNTMLQSLIITSIDVGDINNNSYQEIVLGGKFTQPWGRVDGFLGVMEHRLGTIVPTYRLKPSYLIELPINDVKLADQDMDGWLEVLFAHPKGVDVWEYDKDGPNDVDLRKLTHITSSMNHPRIPVRPVTLAAAGQLDKTTFDLRDHDLLSVRYSIGILEPGDLVEVVSFQNQLAAIYSPDDGLNWYPLFSGFVSKDYRSDYPGTIKYMQYEKQPSLVQLSNGVILLSYVALGQDGSSNTYQSVMVTMWDGDKFAPFTEVRRSQIFPAGQPTLKHPSIFHNPNQPGEVSMTYIRGNDSRIEFKHRLGLQNWGSVDSANGIIPRIGHANLNESYSVLSQDVTFHEATGGFVIAWSGQRYDELKPDNDIFIGYATNDTLTLNLTSRVSKASTDDLYPSISTLVDENDYSIIVAYEEQGINPGGRIMISHSENLGLTWNPPEPLPTQLNNMINYCIEGLGCFLFYLAPREDGSGEKQRYTEQSDTLSSKKESEVDSIVALANAYWIANIEAFSPAIVGRLDGGFAFTYSSNIVVGNFRDFLLNIYAALQKALAISLSLLAGQVSDNYGEKAQSTLNKAMDDRLGRSSSSLGVVTGLLSGINPNSLFAQYRVGEAKAIATGDSDGDARQEIFIASDRGAFLNEISQTSKDSREYVETWTKMDYDHGLNDVSFGDSNGNGFAELMVAGEEGNVYTYEVVNLNNPTTNLEFLKQLWSYTPSNGPNPSTNTTRNQLVGTTDLNQDGLLDVVYATSVSTGSQELIALDGTGGAELWNVDLGSEGYTGLVTTLEITDTNGDGVEDIIIGLSTGDVVAYNSTSGTEIWSHSSTGTVRKTVTTTFVDPLENSTAILYDTVVVIYTPSSGASTIIPPGNYSTLKDLKSVNVETDTTGNLSELLILGSTGKVGVLDGSSGAELLTLNDTFVSMANIGAAVGSGEITGDSLNELFLASGGKVFGYNPTGSNLWNTSTLATNPNVTNMFIANAGERKVGIVQSNPYTFDFEDYDLSTTLFSPVMSNYTEKGVFFSGDWLYVNTTLVANPFYNGSTRSGHITVLPGQDNSTIEFNTSQKFVSFTITTAIDLELRIRGLDSANRSVFLSPVIGSVTNKLINIVAPSGDLKRIQFEGPGLSDWLVIDDLVVGGTRLTAFNPIDGAFEWRHELVPTTLITSHLSTQVVNEDLVSLLTFGYTIHPDWVKFLNTHQGAVAVTAQGAPLWTLNNGHTIMESVNLGVDRFGFLYTNSLFKTYGLINAPSYETLYYEAQNQALWQSMTNREFKIIRSANIDTDPNPEMVIFDGKRLLATVDQNGSFVWKYVSPVPIVDLLVADFLGMGMDQIGFVTSDGRIFLLNPSTGLPETSFSDDGEQLLSFEEVNDVLGIDLNNDNTPDIALATNHSSSPTSGRVLTYIFDTTTKSFVIHFFRTISGPAMNIEAVSLDGDSKFNDLAILGYAKSIYMLNQFGTTVAYLSGIKPVVMTTGDLNGDGVSDVGFIDGLNLLKARYGPDLTGPLVSWTVDTGPYDQVGELTTIDFSNSGSELLVYYTRSYGILTFDIPNFSKVHFWDDPAIFGGVLAKADLDRDGLPDLVVRNENLAYALSPVSGKLRTIWSTPISPSRILQALPTDLDLSGSEDLVLLNSDGDLYAVEGISNPSTLSDPKYRLFASINTLSWLINDWEFQNQFLESPHTKEDTTDSWDVYYYLAFGIITGLVVSVGAVTVVRRCRNLTDRKSAKNCSTQGGAF